MENIKTFISLLKKHRILIAFFLVLVGGYILGDYVNLFAKANDFLSCVTIHQFINPRIDCLNAEDKTEQIRGTEEDIQSYTDEAIKDGRARRISVFYRDLNTLKWFGVNENEGYSPGSLMKLPVAIAFYKLTEIEPEILSRGILFTAGKESLNNQEYFRPDENLASGKIYSIKQLIYQMIANSDNDVVPVLTRVLDPTFYQKVFIDLAINIPPEKLGGIFADFVSTKTYGAVLRALYNASYLNIDQSNDLLGVMSHSSFVDGLVKGLPEKTVVAHKFGEAIDVDARTKSVVKMELHDCGIVYHPSDPYILCVMTEGGDFNELTKIIADVSRFVWRDQ